MVIAMNGCLTEKVDSCSFKHDTIKKGKGEGEGRDRSRSPSAESRSSRRDGNGGQAVAEGNFQKGARKGRARNRLATTGIPSNLSCTRRKMVAHWETSARFFAEKTAKRQTKRQKGDSRTNAATIAVVPRVDKLDCVSLDAASLSEPTFGRTNVTPSILKRIGKSTSQNSIYKDYRKIEFYKTKESNCRKSAGHLWGEGEERRVSKMVLRTGAAPRHLLLRTVIQTARCAKKSLTEKGSGTRSCTEFEELTRERCHLLLTTNGMGSGSHLKCSTGRETTSCGFGRRT